MIVIKEQNERPIKAWVGTKPNPEDVGPFWDRPTTVPDIEETALEQLHNLAKMSFVHPNGVVTMPDVHAGIGATVGSVIATRRAIIPAAVGVDIGCGVNAVMTSLVAEDLPDSLTDLRHSIERGVPLGPGGKHNDDPIDSTSEDLYDRMEAGEVPTHKYISTRNAMRQLGTLGSGNHFIEICLDEVQRVWIMLHSGSRGIGNQIGQLFITQAQSLCEKFMIELPHKDLAYLPIGTTEFDAYWRAVKWAQDYAMHNRRLMMQEVLRSLAHHVKPFQLATEAVNCHHNYVDLENHFGENLYVTRKGAIRAREGDLGIIPGSMGTRSYIVRGRGCVESYHSCSHGAGRRMSRKRARDEHTVEDLVRQTEGVECRKDKAILDEIPTAYKDIDQVMENQKDLVEVVHTLKAVLCVKGA